MIFLILKIAGIWLLLVAILLRGNHRAHRRKMEALSKEPKLPISHIYYANRFGVFRYEGEEMRRFAAEYDLLERGGEL